MPKHPIERYTLVQHSGFAYSGNPQFKQAVELHILNDRKAIQIVLEAGGLILHTYSEAMHREMAENYPPELIGIIPEASGTFSNISISGQRIYIPSTGGPSRPQQQSSSSPSA